MRAVLLRPDGRVRLAEVEPPRPGVGEVEIEVVAAGICGTDLAERRRMLRAGDPTGTCVALGHEVAGVVVAAGPGEGGRWAAGTPVVVDPAVSCGRCGRCARGATNLCATLRLVGTGPDGGGLADRLTVPHTALHRVPAGVPLPAAALVEPLSCAHRAINRAMGAVAEPLDRPVVVLGAGAIGTSVALLAEVVTGAEVLVVEPSPGRRELAAGLGLAVTGGPAPNGGSTVVVEASGTLGGFAGAVRAADKGGVVLVAAHPPALDGLPADEIFGKELTLVWSLGALRQDFVAVLDLLARGELLFPGYVAVPPHHVGDQLFDELDAALRPKTVVLFGSD